MTKPGLYVALVFTGLFGFGLGYWMHHPRVEDPNPVLIHVAARATHQSKVSINLANRAVHIADAWRHRALVCQKEHPV